MKQNNNSGFTLIELLVVIAIIGLLASTVILALNSARRKSRDSKRVAEIKQISTATEVYFSEYGGYPDTLESLSPDYIENNLSAPLPPDGDCDETTNAYTYAPSGTGFDSTKDDSVTVYPGFELTYCLGADVENTPAGVHTLTPEGIQ
jgi:general secretion pathway protein G